MKKIITIQTLLVLSAALCAFGLNAEDQRKPAQVQMQNQSPQQFVRHALTDGQNEIRLGELALKKSEDPQIKSFAQEMVQDHSKANTELREIAQRKGFDVPAENYDTAAGTATSRRPTGDESAPDSPAVGSEDRPQDTSKRAKNVEPNDDADVAEERTPASARRLEGLSGAEFDRSFVKVMVDDHKKAVSSFESASKYLADSELKAFASKTLPTLRMHLEHAQRLDRSYSTGRDDVTLVK
jgi:putative membrane protein